MRIGLGTVLLLAATSLVGVTQSPVAAATGCDAPDTTWVGPAIEGGSTSWDEPTNWSAGVPTATSVVCIPVAAAGPQVLVGATAEAGTVSLEGTLTVAGDLAVSTLEGDFGELRGPGTTTVSGRIFGVQLALTDNAVVDVQDATLGGELHVLESSRLNVQGDAVLEPGAEVDSLGGLFTITQAGSLTFDADWFADILGGFANHGEVRVLAGSLTMMGAEDGGPGQFSDGRFIGAPGASLDLSYTELHDAHLDGVTVDNITVPEGNTVAVAASQMLNGNQGDTAPSIHGEGELVLTDSTVVDGPRFGDSLTVTVPAGEVMTMGFSSLLDQARLQVYGELLQQNGLSIEDDARLDVYGVHRAVRGTAVETRGANPGLEIIHPGGQLLADGDAGLIVVTPFVNRGTVDSGSGFFFVGPEVESPASSSGTFRAGTAGTLGLGFSVADGPQFALDHAIVEGEVDIYGRVLANAVQVRGHLSTAPGGATWPPGQLELTGTTTLSNGASIVGDVLVGGRLEADPGAMGTATVSGAEVTGSVRAVSGRLSVPSLAPSTLAEGTLTHGRWSAAPGATLDLPAITTTDTRMTLEGPGASFGDGLATLTGTGPNGRLRLLNGSDLAVPGAFVNQGKVRLSPGSRLNVPGRFRQLVTGRLVSEVDAGGIGRVRVAGRRDLAGDLVVDREPSYTPALDTQWTLLSSNGRVGPDDRFDRVLAPSYGTRKLRVAYQVNRVRLWVDGVG